MQAVGFDLDDTLAVTRRSREALLREALDAVDAPDVSRAAYLDAHDAHSGDGRTREPVFDALLDDEDDEVVEGAAAAYRETVEGALEPLPGAAALVRSLRDDYRVGLLTDGPVRAQQGKLAELGWTDLFDAVVITGALPATKPDPRTFAALVEELDAPADGTVYVGDHAENDVRGAKRAGLRAVHVVGPDDDPAPAADAVLAREDLGELPAVLDAL